MKKVFISCPMRGRTDEAIKKSMEQMHRIAEIYMGEPLEPIGSFREGAYENNPLECLGEGVKLMQGADYFVGIRDNYDWHGCWLESEIWVRYKGRPTMIMLDGETLMPDAFDAIRTRDACCLVKEGEDAI